VTRNASAAPSAVSPRSRAVELRLAREAGRHVGAVLATVVSLINPGVLMIAGDLAGTDFITGVNEVLYQLNLPRATRHLQVVPARLSNQAALQGMAHLVVDEVYSPAAVDARL